MAILDYRLIDKSYLDVPPTPDDININKYYRSHLSYNDAALCELRYLSDLINLDTITHSAVFSFAYTELASKEHNYQDRFNFVGKSYKYAAEKNGLTGKKLCYWYKEEYQNGRFHIHALEDTEYIKNKGISVYKYHQDLMSYFCSTKHDNQFKNLEHAQQCIRNPNLGWIFIEPTPPISDPTDPLFGLDGKTYDQAIRYQSKMLKGHTIVGTNKAPILSKGMKKKLKWAAEINNLPLQALCNK